MIGKYTSVIFIVIFINLISQSHCQKEGEACVKDGISCTCVALSSCASALEDEKAGNSIKYCNTTDRKKVACCIPSIETVTPSCSPIPASAVKIKKTGRKAADKCIDWEELIQPCRSDVTLLPGASKIRDDLCSHNIVPLIVGGDKAGIDEFPHMALLGFDNPLTGEIIWACAGTLISERWVMTAAHCTWLHQTEYKTHLISTDVKYVRLGSNDIGVVSDPQQMYTVEETEIHFNFTFRTIYNDIALLKLNRDVVFSKSVIPACLHTKSLSNNSIEKLISSGWGNVDDKGMKVKKLVKVTLEPFNFTECARKLKPSRKHLDGFRAETQICAGHHTKINDTCQLDSGGPLQIYNSHVYCTYTVVGIMSAGWGCGTPGWPAVYTRVSAFIPWIENIVWP